jgi:hypothetical protein
MRVLLSVRTCSQAGRRTLGAFAAEDRRERAPRLRARAGARVVRGAVEGEGQRARASRRDALGIRCMPGAYVRPRRVRVCKHECARARGEQANARTRVNARAQALSLTQRQSVHNAARCPCFMPSQQLSAAARRTVRHSATRCGALRRSAECGDMAPQHRCSIAEVGCQVGRRLPVGHRQHSGGGRASHLTSPRAALPSQFGPLQRRPATPPADTASTCTLWRGLRALGIGCGVWLRVKAQSASKGVALAVPSSSRDSPRARFERSHFDEECEQSEQHERNRNRATCMAGSYRPRTGNAPALLRRLPRTTHSAMCPPGASHAMAAYRTLAGEVQPKGS